jgi:PAS domain S-box-containing protein
MKSIIINEYRCDCGKLLFKGLLLDSHLEIKCKRCGKIKSLGGLYEGEIGSHDYSIVYDRDMKVVNASQTAAEYLGYSLNELLKLTAQSINPLLSKVVFDKTWKFSGENENYIHWQAYHRKKDGSRIKVNAKINVYEWKGKEYILFLFKLVENLKKNGEKILENEIRQFLCDFVIEIDWQGQIIYSNQEVSEILGYQPIEIFGTSIFDLIPKQNLQTTKEKISKVQKTGRSFRILDNSILHQNGKMIKIDSFFITILDQNQEVWGYRIFNWRKK